MCDMSLQEAKSILEASANVAFNDMGRHEPDETVAPQLTDQQLLNQKTQSLLIASSLVAGVVENPIFSGSRKLFGSVESVSDYSVFNSLKYDIKELLQENHTLHEKLKEVTNDRDRLLCEVSNLRLELDMSELKKLPQESFPPKIIERNQSGQYGSPSRITPPNTSYISDGSGYVYVQQNFSNTGVSSICNPISYSVGSQPHIVQVHHPEQNVTSYQHHTLDPNRSNADDNIFHPHLIQSYHNHNSGNISSGIAGMCTSSAMQQNLQKKNSIRNGAEILKRARTQTAYELSQDLLEKQIELLERKYGGICARNAAITIQRAFRHYMMVKKFASITAMAKAEKRLSRRVLISSCEDGQVPNSSASSVYGGVVNAQMEGTYCNQPRVTIMAVPPSSSGATSIPTSRTVPTRSLSMRERRQFEGSPLPRSQSGTSSIILNNSFIPTNGLNSVGSTHPHVNLLHVAEPHYYPQYVTAQGGQMYSIVQSSHDGSFSSCVNNSNSETSLNASWVSASGSSPHSPYYSAAQIYMRPKTIVMASDKKKIPPEVPKRTSSITLQQHTQQQLLLSRQNPSQSYSLRTNGLCKTSDNGSLISVQSSGSDSSVTSMERGGLNDISSERSNSPNTWKRCTSLSSTNQYVHSTDPIYTHPQVSSIAMDSVSASSDDTIISSHTSAAQYEQHEQQEHQLIAAIPTQNYKISETLRKRQYRVGLNLFNKKPEKGIMYLIRRGFLENTSQGVARFLITRKGLSRQMIGEYLGNLQNQFNMTVLNCFALELDLSGMQVDVALRKFQTYFRMPGEAQKIERLMEVFSHRFCQCNQDIVGRLRSSDTIFVLAFAIIMLNTDLHTPNLKPERRMRVEDFIKNLRGIDDCHDIDKEMLTGIYERVKANEFKPGSDHVTQVMKVQATIVGKKPNLALPHRRLVCYCRLYEIPDINKKERPGVHQREVFLFNDLLVITKIFSKKKSSFTYTFRNSFPLCGMIVSLLDTANYAFCIQLLQKVDGKVLITFNARNEHDRCKFAEDLKESISEMDEMETLRIEAELERQKSARTRATSSSDNRDSGVADVEVCQYQPTQLGEAVVGDSSQLKRSALSNSLLDMHEQFGNDKPQRRGSVGSLDSGMSISFQSTTTSSVSRENATIIAAAANAAAAKLRFALPGVISTSTIGGAYVNPSMQNCTHSSVVHQTQSVMMPQKVMHHQQSNSQNHIQMPSNMVGTIPARERKLSRSEETGRSTEV